MYFPCGYNDAEKEIKQIKIIKGKNFFIHYFLQTPLTSVEKKGLLSLLK